MKLRKLLVLLLLLGAAFVLSACGEQGAQGETGATGAQGETGAQGDKGAKGDTGAEGEKGEAGTNGSGIQFSYTSEGLAWRYVGETEWKVGLSYSDIFALLEDDTAIFDYFVDAALTGENGATVRAHGNEVVVGETAFKTIGEAVAAAKAAAKPATIYVEAGTYAEELVTVDFDNVAIVGPNANIDGASETKTRKAEAVVTGTIKVSAANTVFVKGLTFSGKGRVETAGAVTNLNVSYNVYSEVSSAIDGVVYIGVGSTAKDLTVSYNYSEAFNSYRFIKVDGAIDGLNASFNTLTNTGTMYDFVNAQLIKGEVNVEGNYFVNSQQSFLYVRTVGVINANIVGNYLENIVCTAVDFRNMTEDGDNTFYVAKNTFDRAGYDWRCIRVRSAGYDENDTIVITVEDNIFLDSQTADDGGNPTWCNDPTGQEIYVIGRNYYSIDGNAVTSVDKVNFANNAKSVGEAYAKYDDCPAYEKPAEVEQILPDLVLAQLNALAADFLADFNAKTGKSFTSVESIDSNYVDGSQTEPFLKDADMIAKWSWLIDALMEAAESTATMADADFVNSKWVCWTNVNAFFTCTQHKDTWTAAESVDYANASAVMAILAQKPAA